MYQSVHVNLIYQLTSACNKIKVMEDMTFQKLFLKSSIGKQNVLLKMLIIILTSLKTVYKNHYIYNVMMMYVRLCTLIRTRKC